MLQLAQGNDPVDAIVQHAREVVAQALDTGWSGPPFDPMFLAQSMDVEVVANSELRDARTVPVGRNRFRIEFNPARPRGRMRFSIAHELAHTFFSDCADKVRHRGHHDLLEKDDWQVEALCNVAAAELLMPLSAIRSLLAERLDIHNLLRLQRKFDVSTEALTIRLAETSDAPIAAFCASSRRGAGGGRLQIDYVVSSRTWHRQEADTLQPPTDSAIHECFGVGYSAQSTECWLGWDSELRVDAVAIPPYPGSQRPRVVGLLQPDLGSAEPSPIITYVHGDASQPRGSGRRAIVQVVNDRTANWGGGGFSNAIRRTYASAQESFRQWAMSSAQPLTLGNVHFAEVSSQLSVASIVAQHGYGASTRPRVRYHALRRGLEAVADRAAREGEQVHMPRIGSGQAGGDWGLIEAMITEVFGRRNISVTVYDLPNTLPSTPIQPRLQL